MIRQSCPELGRFEEEELLHLRSNNRGFLFFFSLPLQPHALCYLLKYCLKNRAYMMKCKANQTRTYDGDGFKRRAACLCLRNEKEDEVLLVSSSRHPDQWIVPGGGMEPDEEPGVAAVREVYEEAGVKGKLGRLLGIFEQHNQDRKHRTYVYALIVTETLEDWEDSVNIGRKRKWFKVEDAIRVLQSHKPVHAEYLCRLADTCSPPYGPVCCPRTMDSKAPHYVVCSAQDSELFNR